MALRAGIPAKLVAAISTELEASLVIFTILRVLSSATNVSNKKNWEPHDANNTAPLPVSNKFFSFIIISLFKLIIKSTCKDRCFQRITQAGERAEFDQDGKCADKETIYLLERKNIFSRKNIMFAFFAEKRWVF